MVFIQIHVQIYYNILQIAVKRIIVNGCRLLKLHDVARRRLVVVVNIYIEGGVVKDYLEHNEKLMVKQDSSYKRAVVGYISRFFVPV